MTELVWGEGQVNMDIGAADTTLFHYYSDFMVSKWFSRFIDKSEDTGLFKTDGFRFSIAVGAHLFRFYRAQHCRCNTAINNQVCAGYIFRLI